jgi:signal transduction histidine kinase
VPSLEAENRRLRVRLNELEREKADLDGFVAVAAHELVEPLIATEAYASIIADRLRGEIHGDSLSDLDTLRRGIAQARLLVETLLAHANAAERPFQCRPVDLGIVVCECLRLMAPEIEFRQAEVQICDLPVVGGEETLIRALFTNLLSNALKHGPRTGGKIVLGARLRGGSWRFYVRSEGSPVPVEDRKRIFDAYQRSCGEHRVRGAGLGLAICRHIVERHGGRIWVTPARGGGNRFCFTLPA